ncbi:hypothetical protein [Corynebacterium sp. HS2168-gen11]|uniref:hypothetical protein n=1 Tax=Corynebacterium sp. HS2168-gen11 TaxID=2974027 RepID=UPI00216B0804|nr:hypothetical protein [Corynebacterium sp. HS2168-gen11]MCS4535776.1 hypothetical protein [Corynebacterium sp. HS2168-gen11]
MSEKQLTVAELLAKSGKAGSRPPQRRRRRSIEEGGVSVAELTGTIPKVDAKPVESKHSSEPLDSPAAPVAAPLVADAPDTDAASSVETPGDVVKRPAAAEKTPSTDETIVLSVVSESDPIRLTTGPITAEHAVVTPEALTTTAAVPSHLESAQTSTELEWPEDDDFVETDVQPEEEKMSILTIAGMVFVGVMIGVAIFSGFQVLWATMDKLPVSAFAVIVTLGVIVAVKLMRTSRDGVSMTLAGLVALVMTFGPLLVV